MVLTEPGEGRQRRQAGPEPGRGGQQEAVPVVPYRGELQAGAPAHADDHRHAVAVGCDPERGDLVSPGRGRYRNGRGLPVEEHPDARLVPGHAGNPEITEIVPAQRGERGPGELSALELPKRLPAV